jgi:hypothetical protein
MENLFYNLSNQVHHYIRDKFVMKTFDPSNNWEKVGEDYTI